MIIDGVFLQTPHHSSNDLGAVGRILRSTDDVCSGIAEVYMSTVKKGCTKGWKLHRKMLLNLVVVRGEIEFEFIDGRTQTANYGRRDSVVLSSAKHSRLTVPPGIWMAFHGRSSDDNIVINAANMIHDPTEAITKDYKFGAPLAI